MTSQPSSTPEQLQERVEKQTTLLKHQIKQRKNIEQALKRETAVLKLLQEVAAAANLAQTVEEAFRFALDKICEYTGWPLGHVYLLQKDRESNKFYPVSGRIWHCDDENRFRSFMDVSEAMNRLNDVGWLGQVLLSGEPHWLVDATQEDNFLRGKRLLELPVKAGMAFPVLVGSEVTAVLEFFSAHPSEPDEDLLKAMTFVGTQLGRVIERQRAEERIRRSEALLAKAQAVAHVGSWWRDQQTDEATWSDELYRIFGLEPQTNAPSTETFLSYVHPDEQQHTRHLLQRIRDTGQGETFYLRIVRADGLVRTLFVQIQTQMNELGQTNALLGTAQDVTDQQQAEFTLKQRLQESQVMAAISQALSETLDLDRVLHLIVQSVQQIVSHIEWAVIHLFDPETETLYPAAVAGVEMKPQNYTVKLGEGYISRVYTEGKVLNISDLQAEGWLLPIHSALHMRAFLAVPIQSPVRRIGTIGVHCRVPGVFTQQDEQLLMTLGVQVAMAIENARLYKAQQAAWKTAETLRAANIALTQTLSLNNVLETFLDYLHQLVEYTSADILLVEEGDLLRIHALRGYAGIVDHRPMRHHTIHLGWQDVPFLEAIVTSQKSLSISDTKEHPDWRPHLEGGGEIQSWLGVPLLTGNKLIGICSINHTKTGHFHRERRIMAEALAVQAASAIQNAQMFTEVQDGRERLHRLTHQVITAQEEERQRISRELHDEAGQALIALKLGLELTRSKLPNDLGVVQQDIQDAIKLADDTMTNIRLLAHGLRPLALDTLGLNATLDGLCTDFAQRTQLKIEYQGVELPVLPGAITITLYRFTQEALTNVAKHAQATQVVISLQYRSGLIILTIHDNGQGFNLDDKLAPHQQTASMGLIGMIERIERLGGQLKIHTAPGQGTNLVVHVPVHELSSSPSFLTFE